MSHELFGTRKKKLGLAVLLALAGGGAPAAEDVPPLLVDPALLGSLPVEPQAPLPTGPQPAGPAPLPTLGGGAEPLLTAVPSAAPPPVAVSAPAASGAPGPAPVPVRTEQPVSAATVVPGGVAAPVPSDTPSAGLPAEPQAGETSGLRPRSPLKPALGLAPPSGQAKDSQPTFVFADRISGENDNVMVAEGHVEFRQLDTVLNANRVTYWQSEDEAEAVGDVSFARDGDRMTGPRLRLKLKDHIGFFESPRYSIARTRTVAAAQPVVGATEIGAPVGPVTQTTTAIGEAERLNFEGKDHYRLTQTTYSTCKAPAAGEMPDWYAKFGEATLDYQEQVGEARDAKVVFHGVPLLYTPWISFALNNQRKSGLLTPTYGSSSKSGFELSVPVYWNIAPDMDATITPRLMTKRGVQWNGEFRYLEPTYSGIAHYEYLPNDRLTGLRRYGYSVEHVQNLGGGFNGTLNLNGVSDDTYFSDLSTRVSNTSQGNLLRQGTLTYGAAWWSAAATLQSYQTLQDPAHPVGVPYQRLPQITLNALRSDLPLDGTFSFASEYVDFRHPTNDVGRRATLYPQVSLPLQTAAFYFTPKLGLNLTRYSLDRRLSTGPDNISRSVPIFSVDSGLTFERSAEMFGRALTQTLEPRLYYLYVPVRDQSAIPLFDTGLADFNFAQIFSENRYAGGDRIGDANQVTAALTSRLIDPNSGAELMRGAIGQRYYLTTQTVTLNFNGAVYETPRTNRKTDLLAALSGLVFPRTYLDFGWQYNQHDARTERLNVAGRYQPETGKVVNAGYRYTRDVLGQVDVSAQWPLAGRWHAVGRYNYSLKDRQLIESVAGLEYDGGCWVARFVVQRLATGTQTASSAVFIQLELNDFSRIGSNPLDLLKRNIPGYGLINQPTADPAFAAQ